jgi:hypothetical protein
MADEKNPTQEQHGQKKEPGKFHYNPGNMAGKTAENVSTDEVVEEDKVGSEKPPHKHS